MIVDVHSHIPTHEADVPIEDVESNPLIGTGVKLAGSMRDYAAAMEPVDRALVFGIAPRPGTNENPVIDWNAGWDDSLNQNDIAARVAASNPDKFIPFMSLHPEQPDIDQEYDRAVGELGCKGIKLALSYQAVDPLSDAAFRLFDRLQSDGLPIVFHNGMSVAPDAVLRYAHPLAIDEVAIAFPRLKMVLAHTSHPWYEDCMAVVRKHPNVWTDISGMPSRPWMAWRAMRVFHEFSATHKMLFGSDWTLWTPQETMDSLRAIPRFAKEHNLPPIPQDEIEAIINRNSLELLGLE